MNTASAALKSTEQETRAAQLKARTAAIMAIAHKLADQAQALTTASRAERRKTQEIINE